MVIGNQRIKACSLVQKQSSGLLLTLRIIRNSCSLCRSIIENKAVLDSRCRTIAEHTTTFDTTGTCPVVGYNTVRQGGTFVHTHTGTATMRHTLVIDETVTNGKTIPIDLVIFFVVWVLVTTVDCGTVRLDIRETPLFDNTLVVLQVIGIFTTSTGGRIA